MPRNWITDDAVEEEIAALLESPYVKLGWKEENIRYSRRNYLYRLRKFEKKGRELAEAGITMDDLEALQEKQKRNGGDINV